MTLLFFSERCFHLQLTIASFSPLLGLLNPKFKTLKRLLPMETRIRQP